MRKPDEDSSGFTLIEMSVVLMILGILFMAFAPGYSLYLKDKRFRTTDARTDDIAAKMFEFRQMNGRYPCPASLTAPRGSATYGQESNCNTATGPTTAGVYVQNSVRSITARAPFSGTPKVIIGAVPFRALNIPEDAAYDANGSRIVVAVTQGLTNIDAFRESEGAISIVNEQNKDFYAANVDPSLPASANPAASGHFVVISPGKTQIGAYSMAGALINPCTGSSADIGNCDYLPGATRQNTAVFSANSYSEGAGNGFFDDIVKFDPGGAKTPWRFDTATGHNDNDVVNMAADKVVLGPDTAANPLGDLSILATATPSMYDGGMNVRGDLRAPWVCDQASTSNTTGCFRTTDLLTQCPAGQYVTGFTDGVVRCSTVYIGCESGEYMEGMDGSGRPICKTIVTPRCGTAANSNWYNRPTTNMCTQTGPTTYFTVAQIGSTAVSSENGGQSQRWDWNCGKGSPGGGPNLTRTQSCTSRQMVDAVCGRLEGPYIAGYDWTGNYITVPNPAYPNPPPVPPATTSIPETIQEREMVPYYGWEGTCQIGSGGSSWTRTLPSNPSWYCAGWNGGQGANCSYSPPPVNGRCGSSVNSCAVGSFQDIADTTTAYLWNCTGRYGGTTASCSSAIPINGSCDNNTVNGCSSGTATGISSNGSYAYWTCAGSNGGSNSPQCQRAMACSAGPVDTPVNGSCNNLIVNGCARGSAINGSSDANNDYWYCSGAFGGSNSGQCSKAKPAGNCILGAEEEINDWDGWAGEGFNVNAPEGGPCVVSHYIGSGSGSFENGFVGCTDSSSNPSFAKSPGPNAGTSLTGKCISRVWRNGSSNADATRCIVFGYRCGSAPPTYTYSWVQGGFGSCSASCGGGTQTQSVTCRRNDGVDVADSFCSGAKPPTSQSCNTQACQIPTSLPMTGTESGNYANTGGYWYINGANGYRRSDWNASGQNPDVLMPAGCDGSVIHEETQTYKLSTGEFYNKYQGGDAGRSYGMDLMDRYTGYCIGANIVAPDNENFQVHYRVYSGRYNSSGRRSELNNEFASCLRTSSASQYNCILCVFGVRP